MATTITDYAGLVAIADDLAGIYILGNDIDASGETWTPLGTFTGTWDGQGYKIKDLTITVSGSDTQTGALITTNTGYIEHLGLTDCVISVTGGSSYVGGIAYANGGTITHCYVTGSITAIATAPVVGWACAGGIAEYNYGGTIGQCHSTATITCTSAKDAGGGGLIARNAGTICESYATGSVTTTGTDDIYAGGFVFWNGNGGTGTIHDCYAKGNASATGGTANYAAGFVDDNRTADSTITNCYSIGTTTGASSNKGFCRTNSGTITNCFWDTQTSLDATSDGGTGKTTAQMKTESTFTDADWNFINTWDILSTVNDGYPYLFGITRPPHTTPPIYDDHGRIAKGARIEARRNDTGNVVETQTLDASGKATFTNLPDGVSVTFYATWGGSSSNNKSELLYSTIIGVAEGGTGSSNALDARTNLGLGTGDSPQFTAVNVGHPSDTTLTRVSAALIAVEGDNLIRASDVDDTPVNGQTAVPVSSNWAFDHNAATLSASVHPISANVDFNKYQGIELVCHKGATMPESPTDGQWFLHTPTGRYVLYQYNSDWIPIMSIGSMTMYVDKTDGTDDLNHGTAVDAAAFATVQYAVDCIPGLVGGNVTININNETYAEDVVIQGKYPTSNYTITLQGILNVNANLTADGNGDKGATTTPASFYEDGMTANEYQNKLLKFTSGSNDGLYRVIDSNSNDAGTHKIYLCGRSLTAQPVTNDTATVYDWGTVVESIRIQGGQKNIVVNDIKGTEASGVIFFVVDFSSAACNRCWASSATNNGGFRVGNLSTILVYESLCTVTGTTSGRSDGMSYFYARGSKFSNFASNGIFIIENSLGFIAGGNVIDGIDKAVADYGVYTIAGSVSMYAPNVHNFIRSCDTGILATAGGKVLSTATNAYSDCNTDESPAGAADPAYID